jgi:hypothetical protein
MGKELLIGNTYLKLKTVAAEIAGTLFKFLILDLFKQANSSWVKVSKESP